MIRICTECLAVTYQDELRCKQCNGKLCSCRRCMRVLERLREGKRDFVDLGEHRPLIGWNEFTGKTPDAFAHKSAMIH